LKDYRLLAFSFFGSGETLHPSYFGNVELLFSIEDYRIWIVDLAENILKD